MHKQVSGWTVNFGPNSPVYPLLRNTPPPFWKTSDLGWPKFTPKYPPPLWKTSDLEWPKFTPGKTSDLGWPKFTPEYPPPHYGKLQIWDDQSLLWNTPPPHPPLWKTSDLGLPKFTPKYPPPIMENFRFGMTKVYSGIPPPIMENFRLGMTKVYSGISPPIMENFRFGMTKVYSEIPPPHYGKLQIWDDQSLLWNTPPPLWKFSDLGWPKFTPKYPPPTTENCQRVQV